MHNQFRNTTKSTTKKRRLIVLIGLIFIPALSILIKLIYMNTLNHAFLKEQGKKRVNRIVERHEYRGSIVDRHGNPLAVTTPMMSIWADPFKVNTDDNQLVKIFDLLNLSDKRRQNLIAKIKANADQSGFIYIKREIKPSIAKKIDQMKVSGIHSKKEYKRFYPEGEVTSHVLGFTGIDGQGQAGIEKIYNQWLSGQNGKYQVRLDGLGRYAQKVNTIQPREKAHNLALSIDRRIQYIAYRAIKNAVVKHRADAGMAIVMNNQTGEILAMVNQPSFNPNNIANSSAPERRNRTVMDVFEPGSVIKTFSAITALKSDQFTPDTQIDTSPGYYRVGNYTVRDLRNYGKISLSKVLMKSSNVGISKAILALKDQAALSNTLREMGFGQLTGIEYPGERQGKIPISSKLGQFPLATLSFGYGLNVTLLQLTQAYAAIANKGVLVKPTLLRIDNQKDVESHRVLNKTIASQILGMLNKVVASPGGTGTNAKLNFYNVAGKTGTVIKAVQGGYADNQYMGLFAGIAPLSQPELTTAVVIDNPKGQDYGGGSVAAPVFKKIMKESLLVLGIRPDKQ
jgi:cell division protein FtsI (penicillin-binding protein 3)